LDPKTVAAMLSKSQKSCLRNMSTTPCVLSCSEATAETLSKPRAKRPALTPRHPPSGQGEYGRYRRYSLTPEGLLVKAELEAL
jgi:hypothetical protein